MNKSDLIHAVSEKTGVPKKDAETVASALFEVIAESLAKDDKVHLMGFGTFEVRSRAARTGRNPKTKEAIEIPAARVPAFKPGKALKDAVAPEAAAKGE